MAAILPIGPAGRFGLARSTIAGRWTIFGAIESVEEGVSRLRAIAAMLLALTLVASACGDDDLSAAGSDQAENNESSRGGDGDPDGEGNASGTENALCPAIWASSIIFAILDSRLFGVNSRFRGAYALSIR